MKNVNGPLTVVEESASESVGLGHPSERERYGPACTVRSDLGLGDEWNLPRLNSIEENRNEDS